MHIHNDGFENKYFCRIQKPFGFLVHLIFHICMRKYKRYVPHILRMLCEYVVYTRNHYPHLIMLIDVVPLPNATHLLTGSECNHCALVQKFNVLAWYTQVHTIRRYTYVGLTLDHHNQHQWGGGTRERIEMKIPPEYCNIYQ